jgi:hypothetical protein
MAEHRSRRVPQRAVQPRNALVYFRPHDLPGPDLARRSTVRAGVASDVRRHHTRRHLNFIGTSVLAVLEAMTSTPAWAGMTISMARAKKESGIELILMVAHLGLRLGTGRR